MIERDLSEPVFMGQFERIPNPWLSGKWVLRYWRYSHQGRYYWSQVADLPQPV